jgi:hypothetical protein
VFCQSLSFVVLVLVFKLIVSVSVVGCVVYSLIIGMKRECWCRSCNRRGSICSVVLSSLSNRWCARTKQVECDVVK